MTTIQNSFKLVCPGCRQESEHPLQVENDRLVGPGVILRLRTSTGERSARFVPAPCPACGLLSLYDADIIQAQIRPSSVTA